MVSQDFGELLNIYTSNLMSQIRNFTEDQLQALLESESRLNSMVESLPQISALPNDKEIKLAQSKSLAEYNLSVERKLKDEMTNLQVNHSNAIQAKQEVELLKAQLDTIAESRSLDTVLAQLKTLAQEAEDESEKISEQFRNGSIDIDDFVRQFGEKRSTSHLRKVKTEKLAELLRQQQYQSTPRGAGGMTSNQAKSTSAYPALGQGYAQSANYRHSYYN